MNIFGPYTQSTKIVRSCTTHVPRQNNCSRDWNLGIRGEKSKKDPTEY